MSSVTHLFVYGTLMSECPSPLGTMERRHIEATGCNLGEAWVRGRLFDAGKYPAAIPWGREIVYGELWQLPENVGDLLEVLDTYEGCAQTSPHPYPYRRDVIEAQLSCGGTRRAWIYLWNSDVAVLDPIPDGRWLGRFRISRPPDADQSLPQPPWLTRSTETECRPQGLLQLDQQGEFRTQVGDGGKKADAESRPDHEQKRMALAMGAS